MIVEYVWLAKDAVQTAQTKKDDKAPTLVTPYALAPNCCWDNSKPPKAAYEFQANQAYQIELKQSWNPAYVTRFDVPTGHEWREIDGDWINATDIRDLCTKIHASSPKEYGEYDMAAYDAALKAFYALPPDKRNIGSLFATRPYLIFEHPKNSGLRAKFVAGGGVSDWGTFDPATAKLDGQRWFALLRSRTKTEAAASIGPNALVVDERVSVIENATKALQAKVEQLRQDLQTIEVSTRGRLRTLCYFRSLEVLLQWSSSDASFDTPPDAGEPKSGELFATIHELMPWIEEQLTSTPIMVLAANADLNKEPTSATGQCVVSARGQVDVVDQVRTTRAAIFAQLTNDTATGQALTELLRENLELYSKMGSSVVDLTPPAVQGSTPQAKALRDFEAAVNTALDVMHEVMGTGAEGDLLFQYDDACPATVATEAGQIAGVQPLEVLLSAVGRWPVESGLAPLALTSLSLATHYCTAYAADVGSTPAVQAKALDHLQRFDDGKDELKVFREVSQKAAEKASDKWAEVEYDAVDKSQEQAKKIASAKVRVDAPEAHEARLAFAKKIARNPSPGQEAIKISSRVLQIMALLDSLEKARSTNVALFVVDVGSQFAAASSCGVGMVSDTLTRLGAVNKMSSELKALGKGLNIAQAVLGIVTGALEIIDGIASGNSRTTWQGVIDGVAGGLALASVIIEGSAFGPIGFAAAFVAVGGMLVVDAILGTHQMGETVMNRVVEAYVRKLKTGGDTQPFVGLLVANKIRGEDVDMLLFKLDPNASWAAAPARERPETPPVPYPFFPQIVRSYEAYRALSSAGFSDADIEAIFEPYKVERVGPNQGVSGASGV